MQPTLQPGSGKAGCEPSHEGARAGRTHAVGTWIGCVGQVRACGGTPARTSARRSGFDAGRGSTLAAAAHPADSIITLCDALLVSPSVCGKRTTWSSPLGSMCAAARSGRAGHRDTGLVEERADVRAEWRLALTRDRRDATVPVQTGRRPQTERFAQVPRGRVCAGAGTVERENGER